MAEQQRRLPWWQRLVQRIAYSRPGVWFFSRTLHYIDLPLLRLTRGRVSIPSILAGLPVITLTTTGAKTGAARTMPVIGIPDGDRFVVIASSWGRRRHPAWRHNLRAHPQATVSLGGRTGVYGARELDGEERDMFWRRAVTLYPGFLAYERTASNRRISVFVLEPTSRT
jgi:deazaflavin-dependent oxidoreductase (nitroreductase family)